MKKLSWIKIMAVFGMAVSFCLIAGCKGEKEEIRGGAEVGSYVTSSCLYMNPLSSFAALGGDSGEMYHIEDGQFIITSKLGDYSEMFPVEEWKWQEFPYSEKQWLERMPLASDMDLKLDYHKMRYQPISDQYELLQMDGQLWLVEKMEGDVSGADIWSIYTLVPEGSMGTAEWTYIPGEKQESIVLRFDLEYMEMSAFCMTGQLDGEEQSGMNITLTESNTMEWSGVTSDSEMSFYISGNDDKIMYSGNIYMIGNEAEDGSVVYKIQLACNGLMMEQNEETGEIVIYK